MSFLYSTHAVQKRTLLPAGTTRETALAALHNHRLLIKLNPLVVSCDPISDSACGSTRCYDIEDRIYLLPGKLWPSAVRYTGDFTDEVDGVRVVTHAPMGFEGRAKWSVEEVEGALAIVEDATLRCPVFLMPFIKATSKSSHDKMHASLTEKIEKQEVHD
ncbi:hypothetical protein FIBSPDRAFT_960868 [Athelia psychrophila]|uniref:DUF7053 domain-containing protein n=1 Tax=Athelia psychrophila TaxID=1759441 RepID=A0A166BXJ8_9AGAM|nr:hypothetical protein FIBSPDRAFT_960868 [Fibularhizoctonia sp. CBS 109695]